MHTLSPALRSPQRLVQQLWRAYCYALATSPMATQSLTAVVGFAAGDACAQVSGFWFAVPMQQNPLFVLQAVLR